MMVEEVYTLYECGRYEFVDLSGGGGGLGAGKRRSLQTPPQQRLKGLVCHIHRRTCWFEVSEDTEIVRPFPAYQF